MTNPTTPSTVSVDPDDLRMVLLRINQDLLRHLAWKTLIAGNYTNTEIVLVCIEVDSMWRPLVEQLMPDHEDVWQQLRDSGHTPNAVGAIDWSICSTLARKFPDLAEIILEVPTTGIVKGIILTEQGCLVADILPQADLEKLNS